MAKSHGRHGVTYLGATTAIPVAETRGQSRQTGADMAEATAQGASFMQYIPGIPDFQLSLDMFYDDAYHVLIDAAIAGTALKMYDYPSRQNTANYFFGNVYVSMDNFDTAIDDLNSLSFTIVPASDITWKHS